MKSMTKMISLVRTLCVTAIVSLLAQSVWAAIPEAAYTYDGHTYTHTGWLSGPDENFSNSAMAFGPGSMGTVGILDDSHHPYTDNGLPASFTLATYMDLSLAVNGSSETKAVIWSAGGRYDSARVMLVTDGANVILSATGGESVSLPLPTAGYHLYTATFSTSGISLTIDANTTASKEGSYDAVVEHFQIGSVYQGCPSGYGHATAIAVAKMIGFDSVLTATEIADLSAANPAVSESTATGLVSFTGSKIYAADVTHTDGRIEVNRGILVVPASRSYSVPAIRFGNSQANGENGIFGMDIDGTLNVTGTSTADGQGSGGIRANVTANVGGILGGEWEGTGTYNIRGTVNASTSYVQLVYDAHAQTWNVENGGVLNVKGFQANTASGKARSSHVLNIKNGGSVISHEGFTRGKLIANIEDGGVLEHINAGIVNMTNNDLGGITGTGKIKFSGTNYIVLPGDQAKIFADTLELENNLANGIIFSAAKTFTIGSLSGTGYLRTDWGAGKRNITIKQTKNTSWSGGIYADSSSRMGTITVTSENGSVLTKSGSIGSQNPTFVVDGNATLVSNAEDTLGTGTITVNAGATLDIAAGNNNGYTIIANGGTIQSTGAGDAHGKLIKSLTLTADSTIKNTESGSGMIGIGINNGATTLALGGYTLTAHARTANTRLYLDKTTITTAGTLNVEQGRLFVHCGSITAPAGTTLKIGANASLEADNQSITVDTLIYNGTATTTTGDMAGLTVNVSASGTGTVPRLTLADGATIAGSLTVSNAAAFGATVKVADGASIAVPANTTLPIVVDETGAIRGTLKADGSVPAVNPSIKVSELPSTSVTLADGVTLILDAVAAEGTTITSSGTIKVADPGLGWNVSEDAKSTILSSKNITLGEGANVIYWFNAGGEKAESYFGQPASHWTNVFGGPTATSLEASTPTEAQWRELAPVTEGKGRVPQYYDANQGGNCENWAPILLDGNLIPFVTAVDDYKTLKSDFYNGWNIRLALVNGVMLEMQALGKLQGDQTKFIGVDATSKLIIDSFQGGSNNNTISFDIASAEGLTVNSDMGAVGNENSGAFEYTFHGNGSMKVAGSFNLGYSHTVKSADIEIGEGEYKTIRRKQLIAFNGTEMAQSTFTLEAVNITDSEIAATIVPSTSLLDGESEFGTARLAVDQTGVYIEYVGKYNGLPPYYQWKFGKKNAAWGDSEGAWQGLFDTATTSLKVWSENLPKESSEQGNHLLNYAKDFVFIFDAATSDSVVVDAALPASRTHTYDGVEGVGYRRVKVTNSTDDNTKKFSFNLAAGAGVDSNGAPLSSFDFSSYNVEMAAPIDATTFNGELGLRAKLTGPITLGPQTKIVFIAPEGEETIAYDYDIRGREGSVEVSGSGTFIVPNTMTGIPFEKTNGGSLKYDIPEGQTVTAAAISGNGGVIKTGAGTLKITEEASFSGALQINEGAVEVIAPSQDSAHAAIQVTVDEGAEMRLVITDLAKDYTANRITGKVVFVNTDGDVLESEGNKYTGTATVAKVGTTNFSDLANALTAASTDESKTVTLIKGCVQAANIPAGVTLDTNGKVFEGAVTGSGTILFKDSAPTAAALEKNKFTEEGWNGTVWLKNVGNTNINANQPLVAAGILMKLGNANSTLKLTDCRGYNNDATNEYPFALELEDGECVNENSHYGWTNVSGYSSRTHTFKALKGTGTYIGTFCEEVEKFRTIEDFEGTLMINAYRGKKIVVGDVNAGGNGTLVLANGAKLNHAFTVKANGVTFGDTVILGSEISSVGSVVMTCPQPTKIPAISGDNVLVYADGAIKVAATVAKIGDKKFATLEAAIAALTGDQDITAITLVDTSITALPAGYDNFKIEGGVIKAKAVYEITVVADHAATTIPASVREDQNEITFSVMPEIDYVVESVKAGDETLEAKADGSYTYTVSANVTITITIRLDVTTITIPVAPAGTTVKVTVNGAEVDATSGSITATIGATVVVTYTAADGYIMTDVVTTLTAGETTTIAVPATGDIVPAVAQVGGTLYATLADAVAQGGEVTLLADVDVSTTGLTIASGKEVTLDLNGHSVKAGESSTTYVKVVGKLTLKDSVEGSTGKIYTEMPYSTGKAGLVRVSGEFVMESGKIEAVMADAANEGQFAIVMDSNAKVTINGGEIKAGWYTISANGSTTKNATVVVNGGELISTADYSIYCPSATMAVTVNGGTVYGATGGIAMNNGTLTVTDGTITSKGQGSTGTWGDGTGNLGKAALYVNAKYGEVTATLNGGTFTAEGDAIGLATGTKYSFTITKTDNVVLAAPAAYYWTSEGLLKLIEITEEEVKPSTEDVQIVVPGADSVEVTTDKGTTVADNKIPFTTGVYTITAKKDGVVVATETLGVINVGNPTVTTTAVAVPFKGATVKNLLNTALLSEGDTILVGDKTWVLDANKVWIGTSPATTAIPRGKAVWVTTAGKIVVLGSYDADETIAAPTSTPNSVSLLANPTMSEYTPAVGSVEFGDQVQILEEKNEDGAPVRYTNKNGDWTKPVWAGTGRNGINLYKDANVAPKIPVGKAFWFIKK